MRYTKTERSRNNYFVTYHVYDAEGHRVGAVEHHPSTRISENPFSEDRRMSVPYWIGWYFRGEWVNSRQPGRTKRFDTEEEAIQFCFLGR